jgi:hypothetical protein
VVGVNVKVPDERERKILRKVVALRAAGQTLDQIWQFLNYRMKARTRNGGEWATNRISFLFQQGLRLLAETEGGDPEDFLDSADDDEEEKTDDSGRLEHDADHRGPGGVAGQEPA